MLTIKRVPTVVSNYREDAPAEAAGCGRNCLGKCCLPGERFALTLTLAASAPEKVVIFSCLIYVFVCFSSLKASALCVQGGSEVAYIVVFFLPWRGRGSPRRLLPPHPLAWAGKFTRIALN